MSDDSKSDIEVRDPKTLKEAFNEAEYVLAKKYQYELNEYPVMKPVEELMLLDISKHTRLFKLESIAYDKNENNLIKLSNVYNALSSVMGNVIILIDSNGEQIDFYIGTKTSDEKDIHIAFKTLEKSLRGNFPGCIIKNQVSRKIKRAMDNIFSYKDESSFEEHRVISAVNGIPSIREMNSVGNESNFSQGIEKLIDSMYGEVYSVVLIAEPIEQKQIDLIRSGYEQLYTKLVPYSSADITLGYNEGNTVTDSITKGTAKTISESLTLSQSHTHTSSLSTTKTKSGGVAFIASYNKSKSSTSTETNSYTEGKSETKGESNTESHGIGIANAISVGESRSIQLKKVDKTVQDLLARIDAQLERLKECGDLGMWNSSAYFIADDEQTSKTAASTYQALIRGDNSGIESISINTWMYDEKRNNDSYFNFAMYLKKLAHPMIDIGGYIPFVTPTSLISGAELTIQAGFPQKSVSGLVVAKYTPFGRQVNLKNNELGSSIKLGKIHHMGLDEKMSVEIDCQSLSSHTFITGSTGSGKSNVVYTILEKLNKKRIPFLVIEPVKGEYKHVLGNREDVSVFGTNSTKASMLKINPFKFQEDIHVLEHIDRLIEIFNVCWPMYAAMPAVLKEAIENAYTLAGWNLEDSTNYYETKIFPSFIDLLTQLKVVITESDFSQELKSNYIGALVTRVKSLTNGINGQIFVVDEIDNKILFNTNVIIDLSRVASMETKSMIMGILIMRLQEYRISEGGINKKLQHVTVLEEAHNLLKRTSTEQSSEGTNILGKSVEMISNSIAEMRTYGEGFIIADQSPSILDLSVIRNTNTKIILRLPDLVDRELVGRAANLNDEQIVEIAKLDTGVAAIYQNNWLEPVLCHVDKYEIEDIMYSYKKPTKVNRDGSLKRTIIQCLLGQVIGEKVEYNIDDLKERIFNSNFPIDTKLCLVRGLALKDIKDISKISVIVNKLFDSKRAFEVAKSATTVEEWNRLLVLNLDIDSLEIEECYVNNILQCLIREKSLEDITLNDMYNKWTDYMRREMI